MSYRFYDYEMLPSERILLHAGNRVPLTPRMFDLLLALVEADGHLLTKEALLDTVWADAAVEEGNLNRTISALRKTLGESKGENRFIETVPKSGYRFVGKVEKGKGLSSVKLKVLVPSEITPAPKPNSRTVPFLLGTLLALLVIASGLYFWFWRNADKVEAPQKVSAAGPRRLTDNEFDEDSAMWTNDNQVRFIRFKGGNKVQSIVMNPDGSDQQAAGESIKDFRAGTWSPNGKKVIFSKQHEDPNIPYIANADGSDEEKLGFSTGALDWSPDSKYLVYNATRPADPDNAEIFVYDIETRANINVSNNRAFDANPSFSPDGKQIIFNSDRDGNAEIYLMNADGSGIRRLTNDPAKEAFQVFSPDGTQIAFNSNRENEKVGIYLLNVNDNSPPVKISDTAYNAEIRPGCWSPDGTRIVFTSDKDGTKFNVYSMPVETSAPELVFEEKDRDVQYPAISPDGKSIVFGARTQDSGELRIASFNPIEASQILVKTVNPDVWPAWSPDGSLIAFNCKLNGNTDICTIKADGKELKNLTANPSKDINAAWSPDGRGLLFSSDREGGGESLSMFVMNADGSGQRRLLQRPGYELTPTYSPDGKRILFSGDRGDGLSLALDIFSIDVNGANAETLIASRNGHDDSPAVSPDGKLVAFVSRSDGNAEIYLMNADGSGLVRITRNAAQDNSPQFSSDGRTLRFCSDRGGKFAVYEITLSRWPVLFRPS